MFKWRHQHFGPSHQGQGWTGRSCQQVTRRNHRKGAWSSPASSRAVGLTHATRGQAPNTARREWGVFERCTALSRRRCPVHTVESCSYAPPPCLPGTQAGSLQGLLCWPEFSVLLWVIPQLRDGQGTWVASLCPGLRDRQAVRSRELLFLLVTRGLCVPERKAPELRMAPCQPPGLRSEMGR